MYITQTVGNTTWLLSLDNTFEPSDVEAFREIMADERIELADSDQDTALPSEPTTKQHIIDMLHNFQEARQQGNANVENIDEVIATISAAEPTLGIQEAIATIKKLQDEVHRLRTILINNRPGRICSQCNIGNRIYGKI